MNIEQLEKQLAYSAARSDIECLAKPAQRDDNGWWFHLDDNSVDAEDQRIIKQAARYLESRNLLRRRLENPQVVQVIDEEDGE